MLVEKKDTDIGSIVVLKMVNGEEIIGKLLSFDTAYVLQKPLTLTAHQNGLAFVPCSIMGNTEKLEINKNNVVFVTEALDDYIQSYIQQTSGLLISRG